MNTINPPRVTVLIDTYNHERFIERAITSVLEQDIPMDDVEILVVDDGSADRTPEVVRCFEPRVRYMRKPNGGQASAFNFALPQAHGDVIAMLDGDDWWARQKLRRVLETLESNPEVGIVGHGYFEVPMDGRPHSTILPGREYRLELTSLANAEIFPRLAGFLGTSKMTIRRSVLERILPIPNDLVIEADEYIFTLAPAISPAVILNEPLFYYGFHEGNLFQFTNFDPTKARRKMVVLNALMCELPPRLRKYGVSEEVISVLFRETRVEVGRIRLSLDGGSRLDTFLVERSAFKAAYGSVTWRYRMFRACVLLQALIFPPRVFYRLRRWYADKGLSRYRSWTGKPVPRVQVIERRPG